MTVRSLDTEAFDELIYDDEAEVLILFHRNGCGVCEEVVTTLEPLEEDYPDVVFGKVDVEAENDLFSRFGLKGVPQVILFSEGNPVSTLSGRKDDMDYENALESLIGE